MNIKKAIEKIYQISTEHCEQDLKNVKINMWDLKRILEALDEPITDKFEPLKFETMWNNNHRLIEANRKLESDLAKAHTELTNCGQRIYKLNEELALANGLVKNLEEQNIHLSDKVHKLQRNPFKITYTDGFVPREEYQEKCLAYEKLYDECICKRDRIDKYYASCEKIREILTELQRSLHV